MRSRTCEEIEVLPPARRTTSAYLACILRTLGPPAFGIVFAVVVAELVVRQVYTLALEYEPGYGFVTAANSTVRWHDESIATSHWIEHGVRRAMPISSDVPRIVALGDSFTEAFMLDDGETYTDVLEHQLQSVQVLNAGRSTSSTADYVAFAERHIRLFSPTWTIVQLRDDDVTYDAFAADRTHFDVSDGNALTLEIAIPPERTGLFWRLRQESMLVGYGVVRLGQLRRLAEADVPMFRGATPRPAASSGKAEDTYPVEQELDALAAAYGGRLTLLLMPPFDPRAPERPSVVEARILAHCKTSNLSCVSPRSAFEEMARRGKAPYGFPNTGFNVGHMNALGHAACAEVLAKELTSRGIARARQ